MKAQNIMSGLALLGSSSSGADIDLRTAPATLAQPVLDSFVSFSLEFVFFPDFAGNRSAPNEFSLQLLDNIASIQGSKPIIRVGGNTQDYALYNASLEVAWVGVVDKKRSADYPTTIQIGPSFFESYATWPGYRYVHGFNMGLGGNRSDGWQTLVDTVPVACRAVGKEGLYLWEYGNEPDLYSRSAQGPVRAPGWNESTFVEQWLNGTREIHRLLAEHCPDMVTDGRREGYLAPSFAGTGNTLKAPLTWQSGLNRDANIPLFSSHNYISGATSLGVTLQRTLMNHSVTMRSVQNHVDEYSKVFPGGSDIAHVLGEANSLYNQGKPGLSNSFGAALWGLDFNLYCASVGIRRVHMHMGTDYRYASWQPIETDRTTMGTKPPYYGNIAVAAMLAGPSPVSISHIPLPDTDGREAAYAAYHPETGTLSRIMVINMAAHNTTRMGISLDPLPPRGRRLYSFLVPAPCTSVLVRRLIANGSDAITGVTWDGLSYEAELRGGRPVPMGNVTRGEVLAVQDGGRVEVAVTDSSAVMLTLLPAVGGAGEEGGGGGGGGEATTGVAEVTSTAGAAARPGGLFAWLRNVGEL